MARAKKIVRDCDIPIASWKTGNTVYEIRYTGPNEFCKVTYKSHGSWGGKTPSLILTEISPWGRKETEYDPYAPSVWGWIVRLITDGTIDRAGWEAISKTDSQLLQDSI